MPDDFSTAHAACLARFNLPVVNGTNRGNHYVGNVCAEVQSQCQYRGREIRRVARVEMIAEESVETFGHDGHRVVAEQQLNDQRHALDKRIDDDDQLLEYGDAYQNKGAAGDGEQQRHKHRP